MLGDRAEVADVAIDPALLNAIYRGDVVAAKDAIARGVDVDAIETDGYNALFYAILADNSQDVRLALVRLLLELKPDVNHCERGQRWTALAFAARGGLAEICQLLVAAGANVDSLDGFGNTPLWRATFHRQRETVAYLVSCGANADLANHSGVSPRMLVELSGETYFAASG
jgi:ankyrin repeat protein